nr:hypothetical protein [Tanacetum cinerariifolium]
MAPKQTTRSTPVITTPAPETTTSVTNAQLQAMIDQGVTAVLAAHDATRDGDDSHTSGMGRPVQVSRECTYPDFLKCQPLNFKGTRGVGHFKRECPKLKNNNHRGNQVGNAKAQAKVYAVGKAGANSDNNVITEEIDKVERYVDGLPDMINGTVMETKPKTMQDVTEFTTELMNKNINTWAERQADNKRKYDDTTRNN